MSARQLQPDKFEWNWIIQVWDTNTLSLFINSHWYFFDFFYNLLEKKKLDCSYVKIE